MPGRGALDGPCIAHRFTDPGMSVPPEDRKLGSLSVFCVAAQNTVAIATTACEFPDGLAFSPMDARHTLYDANTCLRMFIHAINAHPDGKLDQPPLLCQYVIP
jgi:sugar lactone lactonase YvrE